MWNTSIRSIWITISITNMNSLSTVLNTQWSIFLHKLTSNVANEFMNKDKIVNYFWFCWQISLNWIVFSSLSLYWRKWMNLNDEIKLINRWVWYVCVGKIHELEFLWLFLFDVNANTMQNQCSRALTMFMHWTMTHVFSFFAFVARWFRPMRNHDYIICTELNITPPPPSSTAFNLPIILCITTKCDFVNGRVQRAHCICIRCHCVLPFLSIFSFLPIILTRVQCWCLLPECISFSLRCATTFMRGQQEKTI